MEGLLGLILLAVLIGGYMLPTIIALQRKHDSPGPIIIINIFLGWTFLGWVVALAMSVGRIRD
jgi:hypothetical protein